MVHELQEGSQGESQHLTVTKKKKSPIQQTSKILSQLLYKHLQ